jgi:competence protein ComEC
MVGGMVSAAAAISPLIIASVMLLAAAGRGRATLLRCMLCILALAAGWCLEVDGRPSLAMSAPASPTSMHFEGRLFSLPERDSAGKYSLRLRGEGLNVLLKVASSPASAERNLERLRTGDRVRVWCRISRPRGYANPGSRDPAGWLRTRGVDAVGRVKSARLVELLSPGAAGPRRWLDDAKQCARDRLDRSFGVDGAVRSLMGAMLLGDREGIAPGDGRKLRYAGMIHLVAISGLHAGLLAMLLFGGLRRARLSPWLLFALALLLLPAFGVAVGSRPPVLRAAAAAILILLGRSCGRDGDPFNSMALVACSFLICDPGLLRDAGFQLTFMATAGILLLAPPIAVRLPLPRPLALATSLSTAAYLGCAPLLAQQFGWLAPVALLTNLASAPLCAAIIISGYGSILFCGMAPLHEALAALGGLSVSLLLQIAGGAGGLPGAGWRVPAPGLYLSLIYYLLLGAVVAQRRLRMPLIVAFLMLLVWLHIGRPPGGQGRVRAAVLDVGQGQSVVIQSAEGKSVVIDAAGAPSPRFDPGERIILPYLSRSNIRRVELLAISHGDIDHAGGAAALLRELEVGRLWLAPGFHHDPLQLDLAEAARMRGAAVELAERGKVASGSGLRIEVLGPGRGDDWLEGNDASLILRVGERPCRLLLPGDLEGAGERALAAAQVDLSSEALIVAHHGSSGGSSSEFISRVRPLHAIASCGFENRFNHPRPEVIRRFEEQGALFWRTDRDGMLLLEAGRSGWQVRPTRRRERTAPE